jgi:hypothetical protein
LDNRDADLKDANEWLRVVSSKTKFEYLELLKFEHTQIVAGDFSREFFR